MTKRESENIKSKSTKYFPEETQIAKKTQLPDFDKFKKMNMLTLHPPIKIDANSEETENKNNFHKSNQKSQKKNELQSNQKQALTLESEAEQERIKKALFDIASEHIYMFKKITKRVVESKYKKIFEDIYHFIIKLDFYRDSFLQTLLINTDQNADMFFDIMENHFKGKCEKKINNTNNTFNNYNSNKNKKDQDKINSTLLENNNYNNNNNNISSNLSKRDYNFFTLKESNFYDLKSLFIDLQLYEDKELKEDAEMDIIPSASDHSANVNINSNSNTSEKNKPYSNAYEATFTKPLPANIIIIREIHLINPVNFNIFLTKLIDFNLVRNKKFSNVILFDVSYDPKGLFEKIKPNILTKIVFNNLDYVSSKTIYKEILYNFVHGKKKISEETSEFSFFIPNSNKTKKIIDYVTTHQISIPSFEYYFKFLILEFFLFRKWQNMHFLIYHDNLYSKLKKMQFRKENKTQFKRDDYIPLIESFFTAKLQQIRNTDKIAQEEVQELIDIYLRTKNTREVFLSIYEFFESIIEKLGGFNNETNNKYDFIFEFLQFGEKIEKVSNNRTNLIIKHISFTGYVYNIIKNLLVPEFDKLSNSFEEDSEQRKTILKTKKNIESILKKSLTSSTSEFEDQKIALSKKQLEKCIQNNHNSKQNNNRNIINLLKQDNQNIDSNTISINNNLNTINNEIQQLSEKNALLSTNKQNFSKNENSNNAIDDQEICLENDDQLLAKLRVQLDEFFENKIFKDFDKVTNMQNSDFESALIDPGNDNIMDVTEITTEGYSKANKFFYNSLLEDYLNFNEITNPSMQSLFIEDILGMQFVSYDNKNLSSSYKNTNKVKLPDGAYTDGPLLIRRHNKQDMEIDPNYFWSNISYSKLFKHFIILFGALGLEFRLKFFFSDFLFKFMCNFDDSRKVEGLRNVFFKFCHEFYLLGLISRKRPNSDIFVKNFFKMTSYTVKK